MLCQYRAYRTCISRLAYHKASRNYIKYIKCESNEKLSKSITVPPKQCVQVNCQYSMYVQKEFAKRVQNFSTNNSCNEIVMYARLATCRF